MSLTAPTLLSRIKELTQELKDLKFTQQIVNGGRKLSISANHSGTFVWLPEATAKDLLATRIEQVVTELERLQTKLDAINELLKED